MTVIFTNKIASIGVLLKTWKVHCQQGRSVVQLLWESEANLQNIKPRTFR